MSPFGRRLQKVGQSISSPSIVGWPDATNTGYTGALTLYTGTRSINADTTISNAHITAGGFQIFAGATVTLTNCLIETPIDADYGTKLITLTDCTLNAGDTSEAGVHGAHLRITRCNITGGQHSVQGAGDCIVQDSWLHAQYAGPVGSSYHNNAFISNGGTDMQIIHNTLDCSVPLNSTGGGPTADASIFGDFSSLARITFDHNLFKATTGGYGGTFGYNPTKPFGTNPSYIVVKNNVFEHGTTGVCGAYGPVTSFLSGGTGNVWSSNIYLDGQVIGPA